MKTPPPAPPAKLIKVNNKAVSDASPYQLNSFTVTFADLPDSSIGQTTGTGPSASITLDKDAAGHGWYIDPTPLDNTDDYLPTSNPNIWQAKPGSEAQGKMDMLSVLLHEYGHALGAEKGRGDRRGPAPTPRQADQHCDHRDDS